MRVENAEALTHDYIPEKINYREEEYGRIHQLLSSISHGFAPPHMAFLGAPGCGKTLTVKKALLDSEVPYVFINSEPSAYHTLVAIGEVVTGRRLNGLSFGAVWKEIDKRLPEECCIVLDEADRFMTRDRRSDYLLYHLSRRNNTGLFLISNRADLLKFRKDKRVISSFEPVKIYFRPYGVKELEGILTQRAIDALSNTYREEAVVEAVKLIAARAVKRGGDARYAIDLLRESIRMAVITGSRKVTEVHVRRACRVIDNEEDVEAIISLSNPHKLLLLTALTTRKVGAAYRRYNEVASRYGLVPLTERRLRMILADLEEAGFLRVMRTGQRTWIIDVPTWINTSSLREKLEADLRANSLSFSDSRKPRNKTITDFW